MKRFFSFLHDQHKYVFVSINIATPRRGILILDRLKKIICFKLETIFPSVRSAALLLNIISFFQEHVYYHVLTFPNYFEFYRYFFIQKIINSYKVIYQSVFQETFMSVFKVLFLLSLICNISKSFQDKVFFAFERFVSLFFFLLIIVIFFY